MNPDAHAAARCRDGANCTGTGCKVFTGKSKRKQNQARPHPNKKGSKK